MLPTLFLFADIAAPPPPPPPPPPDGPTAVVWVALGLGIAAAVMLLAVLWRRVPAPATSVGR